MSPEIARTVSSDGQSIWYGSPTRSRLSRERGLQLVHRSGETATDPRRANAADNVERTRFDRVGAGIALHESNPVRAVQFRSSPMCGFQEHRTDVDADPSDAVVLGSHAQHLDRDGSSACRSGFQLERVGEASLWCTRQSGTVSSLSFSFLVTSFAP